MQYKSLNRSLFPRSSVLVIRLCAGFVFLVGLSLTASLIAKGEELIDIVSLNVPTLILLYFLSLGSVILYNSTEIVIQNIFGKKVFPKADFLTIRAWRSFFNIYIIEFKDGQSFLFSTSGQLFYSSDAVRYAEEMKNELQRLYDELCQDLMAASLIRVKRFILSQ